jgi:hypothetical protein
MTISRRTQSDKLLREYVSQVLRRSSKRSLVEYDGMGDMGYDMGTGGAFGMGMSYGSPGELYQTFIQPFVDVVGTIAGKTKEVIRSGLTVLNVAFESLMTSLVPFLSDSYDEIFAKEKSDLAKIRSEYQSYYDSTEKALGGSDAKLLAFFAFPGAALTGKFASAAPDAAKSILSVATGGYSDELLGGGGGGSSRRGPSDMFDSYVRAYNSILTEAEKEENGSLASKIKSKKFIDVILDRSPAMKESSRFARELYLKTLSERVELVLDIYEAKTLEELGKIIGEPVKVPDMKEVDPEQKMSTEEAEKKFLEAAKNTSQKAAVGALKKYVQPVQQAFGDDHPFVRDYNSVIEALNSGDVNKIEQVKKQLELSSSKQ